MKFLAATFAALLACVSAFAAEAPVKSGVYRDLLIGYDPASAMLSGYYLSGTGVEPGAFHCIFYLTGEVSGPNAKIRSYFPDTPRDTISGTVTLLAPDHLAVALATEHGGCGNVEHFADAKKPADFTLGAAYPWIAVRVVKSKKVYFYDAPKSEARRKAYLVQGDGVGVKAAANGWLQIDYTGNDKVISGWMRETDFYPAPR